MGCVVCTDGSDEEMRFYAMGNQYLSSIQQGIQAFHVLGEMVSNRGAEHAMVDEWLHNHKTLICLNGGNNAKMLDMWEFLNSPHNVYPTARFHEDQESLGGMLTSIGIIVPEIIYGIDLMDASTWGSINAWEVELATRLKRMPTAR